MEQFRLRRPFFRTTSLRTMSPGTAYHRRPRQPLVRRRFRVRSAVQLRVPNPAPGHRRTRRLPLSNQALSRSLPVGQRRQLMSIRSTVGSTLVTTWVITGRLFTSASAFSCSPNLVEYPPASTTPTRFWELILDHLRFREHVAIYS